MSKESPQISEAPVSSRAKFQVQSVTNLATSQHVKAYAVSDSSTPENERFTKYTPSGELSLTITNENLYGFFKPGENYYIDITPTN